MSNKKVQFAIILLTTSLSVFARTESNDEGKAIFGARCAACHNVNVKVVGPALAGVDERRSIDWIIQFVHSSQTLVKSNDKSAVELFHQFSNTIMPDHPDLSAEQIKSIVDYIKSQAKSNTTESSQSAKPTRLQPNYLPIAITNFGFFGSYIGLVFLLVAILVIAVKVKELERRSRGDSEIVQ